jgi:hypothetical protein
MSTEFQNELDQARYDAVVQAIAAATSDSEAAQLRYQQAMQVGDMHSAAEAQRMLSRSEARLVQLEAGKDAWDERQATVGQQQTQQRRQVTPQDVINSMAGLTEKERAWLLERPHLVLDQRWVTRMQDTYNMAAEKGLQRDSLEYFCAVQRAPCRCWRTDGHDRKNDGRSQGRRHLERRIYETMAQDACRSL